MTKLFGGEILYTSQHAAIYTRQCVTVPKKFQVRYLFSVSNFSGTCSDIFSGAKFYGTTPQKKLNISGKGGNDHPCLYVHLQWQ